MSEPLSEPLSPSAQVAFRKLRALRKVPTTGATAAAERYVVRNLGPKEILAVALALDADDVEKQLSAQQAQQSQQVR